MSYVKAALNTLRATRLEVWLARIFGTKSVGEDSGCVVTLPKVPRRFAHARTSALAFPVLLITVTALHCQAGMTKRGIRHD